MLKLSVSKELEIKRKKILSGRFRNDEAGDEYTIRCECGTNEEEGKTVGLTVDRILFWRVSGGTDKSM